MSLAISKQLADALYEKAGDLIPEDPHQISIEKYNYLGFSKDKHTGIN